MQKQKKSIRDREKKAGAIAQLGEHLLCKQRVVGSIPTGSTRGESGSREEI